LEFKGILSQSVVLVRVGLCFTFYSGDLSLPNVAIDFFTNRFWYQGGVGASEAVRVLGLPEGGNLDSLLPLSAMIATPYSDCLSTKLETSFFYDGRSILLMPVYLMMAYLPCVIDTSLSCFPGSATVISYWNK